MGAVADITHIIKPKIDEAERKGIEQGLERGIEQGIEKKAIKIAKNMLIDGEPIAKIGKFTGLSIEKIKKLQAELDKQE